MNILLVPNLSQARGGPATFQHNFVNYLLNHTRHRVFFHFHKDIDTCLVVNGSINLAVLLTCKLYGKRVVQRLGSFHRSNQKSQPGLYARLKYFLQLCLIHIWSYSSDLIIFQSQYALSSWPFFSFKQKTVIYNGSNVNRACVHLTPSGSPCNPAQEKITVIIVEATLPKPSFSRLLKIKPFVDTYLPNVEYIALGAVDPASKAIYNNCGILSLGHVDWNTIESMLTRDLIYLFSEDSFDLHCGCPNSVLEAMALGARVIGYRQSPLNEICDMSYDLLLDYDPLDCSESSLSSLGNSIGEYIKVNRNLRVASSRILDSRLSIKSMAQSYLSALEP